MNEEDAVVGFAKWKFFFINVSRKCRSLSVRISYMRLFNGVNFSAFAYSNVQPTVFSSIRECNHQFLSLFGSFILSIHVFSSVIFSVCAYFRVSISVFTLLSFFESVIFSVWAYSRVSSAVFTCSREFNL